MTVLQPKEKVKSKKNDSKSPKSKVRNILSCFLPLGKLERTALADMVADPVVRNVNQILTWSSQGTICCHHRVSIDEYFLTDCKERKAGMAEFFTHVSHWATDQRLLASIGKEGN